MWRATQNLLPTADNLWIREIRHEPTCRICKQGMENIAHALLHCKVTKKIWRYAPFETCFPDAVNQDILDIIFEMAKKLTKSDIEIMVAICWAIWYGKNKYLF